jgi:hypothetical protein
MFIIKNIPSKTKKTFSGLYITLSFASFLFLVILKHKLMISFEKMLLNAIKNSKTAIAI